MKIRRLIACLCVIALLPLCAAAESAQRVYTQTDAVQLSPDAPVLEIYFPPVKGADACILRMGEEVIVVDAATTGQYPRVSQVLKELGITQVKTGFNTHPHDDHIQGFQHICDDVQLGEFLYTFPEDANNNMINALSILRDNNVPCTRVGDGHVMQLGEATLTVIQREKHWFSDNNRSAMIKVEYGDCALLLAADVELDGQNMLLETTPEILDADILKYPHHGVDRAGWNFLKHVSAELAVITNGRYSVKNTRQDAEKRHLPLIYTDEGTIRLRCDGSVWLVDQQKAEK